MPIKCGGCNQKRMHLFRVASNADGSSLLRCAACTLSFVRVTCQTSAHCDEALADLAALLNAGAFDEGKPHE